ncbi:hypothetical protein BKA69DRAFT_697265 [Paraphysoderma sedebokerense]|nr:hypothetical protein BKA69DRAFT_697265 [Paraphysoderma sedebokerense]
MRVNFADDPTTALLGSGACLLLSLLFLSISLLKYYKTQKNTWNLCWVGIAAICTLGDLIQFVIVCNSNVYKHLYDTGYYAITGSILVNGIPTILSNAMTLSRTDTIFSSTYPKLRFLRTIFLPFSLVFGVTLEVIYGYGYYLSARANDQIKILGAEATLWHAFVIISVGLTEICCGLFCWYCIQKTRLSSSNFERSSHELRRMKAQILFIFVIWVIFDIGTFLAYAIRPSVLTTFTGTMNVRWHEILALVFFDLLKKFVMLENRTVLKLPNSTDKLGSSSKMQMGSTHFI